MTDYVRPAELERRKAIRLASFIGMGAIYVIGAGLTVVIPWLHWSLAIIMAIGPIALQAYLFRIPIPYKEDNDWPRLLGVAGAAVLVIIANIVVFGSKATQIITYWSIGSLLTVSALGAIVLWAIDGGLKRWTIIVLVVVGAGLLAGTFLGSPLISWICTGVEAALTMSVIGEHATTRRRGHVDAGREAHEQYLAERLGRDSEYEDRANRVEPDLLISMLRRAERRIRIVDRDRGPREEYYPEEDADILTALGALENLSFVSHQFVNECRSQLANWHHRARRRSEVVRPDIFDQLTGEIEYAIYRIRAHRLGALYSALSSLDGNELKGTIKP